MLCALTNIRKEDTKFADGWESALDEGMDWLELEARRRAVEGTLKPVYQGGKKVGTVREYSDILLIFLLKGGKPDKYRERRSIEHSGKAGQPVELVWPFEVVWRRSSLQGSFRGG